MSAPPRDGHRPEIQGLRAIAALLVVLFHLWPAVLPGGYIGVDIFFVISGFLITSHLLREVGRDGRVQLAAFWARRARRLLPGALTVLAVSAVGTWLWVPHQHWPQFFREIIASGLYVENWALARDSVDYLAQDNAASPVQHYWTLSAEEQFYLVWPLLVTLAVVWAARRRIARTTAIAVVLGAVTAISLVHSLVMTTTNPAQAYFVTTTRAWEFGAGALLAFAPVLTSWSPRLRSLLSWAAIAVLIGAGFVYDDSTTMPGVAAVVVVIATVAFLAAGGPTLRWSPLRILGTRPAQTTGDISYALYLWHWPLIILIPYARVQDNGPRTLVAILVLTFVLSYVSTRWIEDPVRHSRRLRARRARLTYGLSALAMAAVVVPAALVLADTQRDLAQERERVAAIADDAPRCFGAASHDPELPCENPELADLRVPDPATAREDLAPEPECASHEVDEEIVPCTGGPWDDPDVPKIAIIGDSHARMYSTPVRELAEQGLVAFDGYFQSGCIWTSADPFRTRFGPECVAFKGKLRTMLAERADRYDLVITAGRVSKLDGDLDEQVDGLLEEWSQMTDRGIPVVAIADAPEHDNTVNDCLERTRPSRQSVCALDRADVLATDDPMVVAAERGENTHVVDLTGLYCDETTCPAVIGGATVYLDSNHFTATFARTFAPMLWRELEALGLMAR